LNDLACASVTGSHFVSIIVNNAGTSDNELDTGLQQADEQLISSLKNRSLHFQEAFYRGVGVVYANNKTFDEGTVTQKVRNLCRCPKFWYVTLRVSEFLNK
jgi:hypothetical protein